MRGILVRVAVIAVILGGIWLFRDYISGSAQNLAVGDCFDVPNTETVDDVSHHPCTDAHTGEVFYVADHAATGAFPGMTALRAFTDEHCPPAFDTYTGLDYYGESAQDFDYAAFFPLEEGWEDGDHEITCFIVRVDQGTMTGSLRKQ
jgi:Septum formation